MQRDGKPRQSTEKHNPSSEQGKNVLHTAALVGSFGRSSRARQVHFTAGNRHPDTGLFVLDSTAHSWRYSFTAVVP